MITLYQIGRAGYWTGHTQVVEDDATVASGWTASPIPETVQDGEYVRMTLAGWKVCSEPMPAAVNEVVPTVRPLLAITAITADADHANQVIIDGVNDVTCTVGTVLTFNAELRDSNGGVIPTSDSFRMPLRSRDGREKVLLAVMQGGHIKIVAPMRESGIWSVTQETVNESLQAEHQMTFAGAQVYVVEA
ncbi:hypothetical protein Undi14_11930 [Undibacterium sp. 14-3-2]|uniref:hypothetical protein n=1 Tax=Undibacterium sp. 14-3-2 TaxID=2800129 RepID=UPI001904CAF9|nr:hypothetical protein [Undibacterium sp. 14-3-2]MBK1890743.1 hypothetical protein [Undibacterium sp. 14-3-2]